MHSSRRLLAFSAVGVACVFLSLPAQASTSWEHNGSVVVLEESGKKRKLVYAEPRGPLNTAGVKRGTVLFDGEEKADGRLAGYAKLFRAGCDPVDYFVEGSFDKSKGEILLQGQAPIYSGQGCKITGYSDDNTASSLKFRQQGGAYASSADQAGPDADARYSSRYGAAQDDPATRDNPAYADPRSADPRYGERGYVNPRDADRRYTDPRYDDPRYADPRSTDPRYSDPRYADPRTANPRYADPRATDPRATDPRAADPRYADPRSTDPRYSGRDYADRQPAYPPSGRNDSSTARPANPDDPDADGYMDDNEDEPAYVPYRPRWRWGY